MGRGDFFVLDAEVGIIFLLLLLSLVKSKWRMNSDLSERNREAFCQKQRGVLYFLHVFIASLFLFLSPCIHRLSLSRFHCLSLSFYLFVVLYSLILTGYFFVIYNERILNDVIALPTSIIYRFLTYTWHNFKWAFFLTWQHLEKGFCFYI